MWTHVCIYVPLFWQVGSRAIWIDQQRSRRNTAIAAMECHSSKSLPPHRGKDIRIGLSMPRVTPPLHLSIAHGGTIAICHHLKKQKFLNPISRIISYNWYICDLRTRTRTLGLQINSGHDSIWWTNRTRKAIGCYFIIEHNGSPRLYAREWWWTMGYSHIRMYHFAFFAGNLVSEVPKITSECSLAWILALYK